jgi:hypothetical protein
MMIYPFKSGFKTLPKVLKPLLMETGALEIQGFFPGWVGKSCPCGAIDTFYAEGTEPGCSILEPECMIIDLIDATGALPAIPLPKFTHIRA